VAKPPLTVGQILARADEHSGRTGKFPSQASGLLPRAPGENWAGIDRALARGQRDLAGGDSLAKLLTRERGHRNKHARPPLTEEGVAAWAREHHARAGAWPGEQAGPVAAAPGETWRNKGKEK
jgi:hypothetical protein